MSALRSLKDIDVQQATDADSVAGIAPTLVARPTSTDEVAAVLRAASEDGLAVVPRGCGTTLDWAPAPTRCDVILDLSRMRRLLEHQAGDLIVAAEAGMPLTDLQEAVAGAGQRLALDEVVPGTSVGGLIATNLSGPRRMAYGTTRDLLIGVTIVRADGVVAKAGGKVVKNVAGYDLGKLMIGSHGTLAVVTSAYFRLHPTPRTSAWVVSTHESPTAATAVVRAAVHSQVAPAAVEIDAPHDGATSVGILLEGTEVGVDGRAERTLALSGSEARRTDSFPSASGLPGPEASSLLKVTCQLSSACGIAQAAHELGIHVRGSVGTGVLYASVPDGLDGADVVHRLRERAHAAGGAVVVMRGAPPGVDAWGPVPGLDLMRAVKHRFDPENLLSPGRFVGGI